ncbi:hypothetical protein FOA24_32960 [Bacillus thuringiensis]|uniref:insecticidal delta-endotoxin Cry8Ea1 family protein n=1 Tax=Bacillus thuringiensis TaxID=1428 RepID=UPI00333A63A5
MNQNYGSNEVEILGSRNMSCQPRYPFAKAPCSELQNMNYKDWLVMCSDEKQSISKNQQRAVIDSALLTTSDITQTILNIGNTATSRRSPGMIAGQILLLIIRFLWTKISGQRKWTEMIKTVELLIKKALIQQMYDEAVSRLEGLEDVVDRYLKALDDLHIDPTNLTLQEEVRIRFDAADTAFIAAMPQFRPGVAGGDSQVLLLPVYTQAANLHLLLLRDAIAFGGQWGMDPATINTNYNVFLTRLSSYTDHCRNTYDIGLQKAHQLPPNYDYKSNDFPWISPGLKDGVWGFEEGYWRHVIDWNYFNNYRRNMTIMVLDVVSLWPTYDVRSFPIPVKSELTRELYSELMGQNNGENQDQIESMIVRPPHLFTWLKTIKIGTKQPKSKCSQIDQYADIKVTLHHTNDNNLWDQTTVIAAPRTGEQVLENSSFGRVELSGTYSPYMFRFYTPYNGGGYFVGRDVPNTTCYSPHCNGWGGCSQSLPQIRWYIGTEIPSSSLPHSHRLSYIDGCTTTEPYFDKSTYISAWVFAWTHNSVGPNNTIFSDKITQIPAVKGNGLENIATGTATVRRGTGSTGGDFVQLIGNTPAGEGRLHISFTSLGARNYRVRFRYGSTTGGRLRVSTPTGNKYTNIQRTYGGGLPTAYNEFQYADLGVQTVYANHWLVIVAETGTNVVIDKIEFIPA